MSANQNPYVRRPSPAPSRQPDGLADVLERILDKGLVIAGDIQLNLLDIELITIKVRLLLASADTAQQMGIDWWKHDPFLSGKDRELAQENEVLRTRVDQLEAAMGEKLARGEPSPGDLVGEGAMDRGQTRGQRSVTGALPQQARDAMLGRTSSEDDTSEPGAIETDELLLEPTGEGRLEVTEVDDERLRVTAVPDETGADDAGDDAAAGDDDAGSGEEDLEALTKAELQQRLRDRDLPISGNKPELIERLRQAAGSEGTSG
jgi:hypothetical protein